MGTPRFLLLSCDLSEGNVQQWDRELTARRFLRYLALSPALASPLLFGSSLRKAFAANPASPALLGSDSGVESIKSADQALSVMEFEEFGPQGAASGAFRLFGHWCGRRRDRPIEPRSLSTYRDSFPSLD